MLQSPESFSFITDPLSLLKMEVSQFFSSLLENLMGDKVLLLELWVMILGEGHSFEMSPLNSFKFLGEFHLDLVIYLI